MSLFFNVSKKGLVVRALFGISAIVLVITFILSDDTSIFPNKNNGLDGAGEGVVTTTLQVADDDESTRKFDPNMLNVSISSDIRVDNESYSGLANIMNIQNANEYFIVDIKLDETGEIIYQSPKINNQEKVDIIEISKGIDTGKHTATASFNAYDKNTDEYITTVALEIDVTVVKTL